MSTTVLLVEGAVILVIGGAVGYVIRHYVAISRRGSIEAEIEEKMLHIEKEIASLRKCFCKLNQQRRKKVVNAET